MEFLRMVLKGFKFYVVGTLGGGSASTSVL